MATGRLWPDAVNPKRAAVAPLGAITVPTMVPGVVWVFATSSMSWPAVALNAINCGTLALGVANVTGAAPTVVMIGAVIDAAERTKSVALVADPFGVVTVIGADIAENVPVL